MHGSGSSLISLSSVPKIDLPSPKWVGMVQSSQWLTPPSLSQSLNKMRAFRGGRSHICHHVARCSGHYKRCGDEIRFLPHRHAAKRMLINALTALVPCQQPMRTRPRAANLKRHFTVPLQLLARRLSQAPRMEKLEPAATDQWVETTVLLRRSESASIGAMQRAAMRRNRTTRTIG